MCDLQAFPYKHTPHPRRAQIGQRNDNFRLKAKQSSRLYKGKMVDAPTARYLDIRHHIIGTLRSARLTTPLPAETKIGFTKPQLRCGSGAATGSTEQILRLLRNQHCMEPTRRLNVRLCLNKYMLPLSRPRNRPPQFHWIQHRYR